MRTWSPVVALLVVLFLQVVLGARQLSATFDETAHLPAGYTYLETGDLRLNPQHPPLVKLIAAVPLLVAAPAVDLGEGTVRMMGALTGPHGFPVTHQPLIDQVYRIDGRRVEAGEKMAVRAEMALPEKLVNLPVAAGTDIHMTLELRVPVKGFIADVRRRVNLGPIGLDPLANDLNTK